MRIDGDALVMHAGDKPYVVTPTGQVDLATKGLTLEAVDGIVGQLLSTESRRSLQEFGAVQYELPSMSEFPSERFTVVAARGGDDLWVEVRRHRTSDADRIPDGFFTWFFTAPAAAAAMSHRVVAVAASDDPIAPPASSGPASHDDALSIADINADRPASEGDAPTASSDEDLVVPDAPQRFPDAHQPDEEPVFESAHVMGPHTETACPEHALAEPVPLSAIAPPEPPQVPAWVELPPAPIEPAPVAMGSAAVPLEVEVGVLESSFSRFEVSVGIESADAVLDAEMAASALHAPIQAAILSFDRPIVLRAPPDEAFELPMARLRPAPAAAELIELELMASPPPAMAPVIVSWPVAPPPQTPSVSPSTTLVESQPPVSEPAMAALGAPIAPLETLIAPVEPPGAPLETPIAAHEPPATTFGPPMPVLAGPTDVSVDYAFLQPVVAVIGSAPVEPPETPSLSASRAVPEEPVPAAEPSVAATAAPVAPRGAAIAPPETPIVLHEPPAPAFEPPMVVFTAPGLAPEPIGRAPVVPPLMTVIASAVVAPPETLSTFASRAVLEEAFAIPELAASAPDTRIAARQAANTPPETAMVPSAARFELPEPVLTAPTDAPAPVDQEPIALPSPVAALLIVSAPATPAEPLSISAASAIVEEPVPVLKRAAAALDVPIAPDEAPIACIDESPVVPPDTPIVVHETPGAAVVLPMAAADLPVDAPEPIEREPIEPVPSAVTPAIVSVPFAAPPLVPARFPSASADMPAGASRPAALVAPPPPPAPPPPAGPPPQPAVVLPMTRTPFRGEQPAVASVGDPTMDGLQRLLRISAARGASTMYLASESRPSVRLDGELQMLDAEPVLTARDVESLLLTLMPERSHEALRAGAPSEWICDIEEVGRVRCTTFRDHLGSGAVFRLIPARTVSADQLGLPKAIQALAIEPEGLILIVGPRLSGKRTLISAFVDLINRTRRDHVIAIEREISIVHSRGTSFISQREVRGTDEEVLGAARAALREDPDVLVLEDLRTGALMDVALEAASSGRLVIGGFSAHTATAAVDRIIDLYPPERRRQVQLAVADNLRGVISQVLLRKVGGGRTPAREVLLNTPAVSSIIAEGKTSFLPMAIEGGRRDGMIPFNDSLMSVVRGGTVDGREAYRQANDRPALVAGLKRQGVDTSFAERLA